MTLHGRRILRHKRGNPETDVSRNLNEVMSLLYSTSINPSCSEFTPQNGEVIFESLIPEPSSITMILFGSFGVISCRRRVGR
jgi:hypothetical protein